MATDMLENCELSALDDSRLGNRNFIDEGQRVVKRQVVQGGFMFTGEEDFYNLFGSRNKKKSNFRLAQRNKYKDLKDDCDNIQVSIDIISNDVATLLKRKSDLENKERLSEANTVLGEFKNKQIANRCEEVKAASLKESERAKSLELLTSLSDTTVDKAKGDLAGLIGGDAKDGKAGETVGGINKKVLLYGGIGLGVLVVAAILIRK
jgi:hypothetical protein